MYSKETFVVDISIRPFKFAKFELSGSILCSLKRGKARLNLTRRSAVASPWEQYIHCTRAVGAGGPRGHCPLPFFSRSFNPTSTREGERQIMPTTILYAPFLIFRPSYGPVYPWGSSCATTYTAFDLQYGKDRSEIFFQNMFERSWAQTCVKCTKIIENDTNLKVTILICTKFSIFCASPIACLNCAKK